MKLWTSEDPRFAAGLTLFSVRDIPMENVQKAILEPRSHLHPHDDDGESERVPAATHIYNMPDEVDRLIASVKHVAENASRYMTTTSAQ